MHADRAAEAAMTQEASRRSYLRENIEAIVVAVLLALCIRTYVVQAFKIPSGSMKPTLQIGDHILVNKFSYGIQVPFWEIDLLPARKPRPGDIIVFKFPKNPDKDFIKRVIGGPGDIIEIKEKVLYINNRPVAEDFGTYLDARIIPGSSQPRDNYGPAIVPENGLFVLGDNRDHSYDSRFWGFVPLESVRGKAFIIYWSWNKQDFGIRWGRIGDLIN